MKVTIRSTGGIGGLGSPPVTCNLSEVAAEKAAEVRRLVQELKAEASKPWPTKPRGGDAMSVCIQVTDESGGEFSATQQDTNMSEGFAKLMDAVSTLGSE